MSSVAALRGSFPGHAYVAAKGGIISLTKGLAGEYAKNGIRANAIAPGLVKTERVTSASATSATRRLARRAHRRSKAKSDGILSRWVNLRISHASRCSWCRTRRA
jgi:NAD(P)-dependent dehydrogenase (short-subunit alcohol dehydrogenase family)